MVEIQKTPRHDGDDLLSPSLRALYAESQTTWISPKTVFISRDFDVDDGGVVYVWWW
ncbi:hypothetical protein CC2G_013839 [Coprinopsis cinerea AmutBmut pab1-1]|nr:hypothetical protein CC2G_013839 [Coprinopsis cinerea AmutBmut pab1-1]